MVDLTFQRRKKGICIAQGKTSRLRHFCDQSGCKSVGPTHRPGGPVLDPADRFYNRFSSNRGQTEVQPSSRPKTDAATEVQPTGSVEDPVQPVQKPKTQEALQQLFFPQANLFSHYKMVLYGVRKIIWLWKISPTSSLRSPLLIVRFSYDSRRI